jgi:hypothetical protein
MQDKVLALREKTAVARRLADENTLGLNQLKSVWMDGVYNISINKI